MRDTSTKIAIISVVYVIAIALFLGISGIILQGSWELLGVFICVVLTLPLYTLAVTTLTYKGTVKRLQDADRTPVNIWEKSIALAALLLSALSVAFLIPIAISLATHIRNALLRRFCNDFSPTVVALTLIGSLLLLANRPASRPLVRVWQRKHPVASLEGAETLRLRIGVLLVQVLVILILCILIW